MHRFLAVVIVALALSLFPCESFAQSGTGGGGEAKKANRRPAPTPTSEPRPVEAGEEDPFDDVITVDTNLVTIPVRVLDKQGRFVGGLTQSDFKIFEDNVEQDVAYFSNEQNPFTVALVLDMSYSSTFKIDEIQQAALTFVTQLRPNDKVMVISFDQEVHILCEPTSDRKLINNAIVRTRISSGTSLYDAVDFVVNKRFNKIEGRKAVVLFTDGVDTTSRAAHDRENLRDASELDALVYPIKYDTFADVQAIERGEKSVPQNPTTNNTILNPPINGGNIPTSGSPSSLPFPLPTGTIRTGGGNSRPVGVSSGQGTTREEYERAEVYLDRMAMLTGGRVYEANSPENLSRAFSRIASELREFYSIGFYPNEAEPGKTRKLKVKVAKPGVAVRARDSYVVRPKDVN
ncbi:MAG: VWA domain-containing protein [Acidobacteria bacterium]|nr:MAG: VWA domain-containing protein [Acidobacteriota bacterium]REK02441.1 MAG: VWA domain-containing protein [Acidobacteriota bacterium]REK13758.1 MAG: VWA domain-containing protein [Acidobacteriota bacterium]REK41752.1 MAG: VWA domain-containing protein [Acidobacteriota bacterium]